MKLNSLISKLSPVQLPQTATYQSSCDCAGCCISNQSEGNLQLSGSNCCQYGAHFHYAAGVEVN